LLILKILNETLFKMAFRKPPVILKSNTVTLFKNYLNFRASSPAYGTFYRITGGFLNAATTILLRLSVKSPTIIRVFIEANRNFSELFLAVKMKKKI